ncbi:MAG: hypothetical protein RJP95_04615 [Pirellulales bacterium]
MSTAPETIRAGGVHGWEDLVGHVHAAHVQMLHSAFLAGDWRRHLLLLGEFGFGKSSFARFLIAAAACLQREPETANPCWSCFNCKQIADGVSGPDVFSFWEVDCQGLSAECAREYRSEFEMVPDDRYAAVFFDEFGGASPPAMSTFKKFLDGFGGLVIAATTHGEVQNIPAPVHERFEKFCLGTPEPAEVAEYLKRKCVAWEIVAAPELIDEVVNVSQGSFRECLRIIAEAANAPNRELNRSHLINHRQPAH